MNKYDNRCFLCAVIYGIFGAFECYWAWSSNFLFTIISGIIMVISIIVALILNIISIIYVYRRIRMIIWEICITFVCYIIFSVVASASSLYCDLL